MAFNEAQAQQAFTAIGNSLGAQVPIVPFVTNKDDQKKVAGEIAAAGMAIARRPGFSDMTDKQRAAEIKTEMTNNQSAYPTVAKLNGLANASQLADAQQQLITQLEANHGVLTAATAPSAPAPVVASTTRGNGGANAGTTTTPQTPVATTVTSTTPANGRINAPGGQNLDDMTKALQHFVSTLQDPNVRKSILEAANTLGPKMVMSLAQAGVPPDLIQSVADNAAKTMAVFAQNGRSSANGVPRDGAPQMLAATNVTNPAIRQV